MVPSAATSVCVSIMDVVNAGSLLSKRSNSEYGAGSKASRSRLQTGGNFPLALTSFDMTDEIVDGFVCELLQGRCFNCQSRSKPASNALCVPIPGNTTRASLCICRTCARLLTTAIMGRNVVKLNSIFSMTSLKAGCNRPTIGELYAGACASAAVPDMLAPHGSAQPPQASNGAGSGSPNRKVKASKELFVQFLKRKHGGLMDVLRQEAKHALLNGLSVGRCLVWAYVS